MKSAFEENRQNAMKIISYASVTIKEKGPLAPSRRATVYITVISGSGSVSVSVTDEQPQSTLISSRI